MKKHVFVILIMSFLLAPTVLSADSFRLESGQLLQNGMTKGEVLDKAGKPKMKDTIRRAGVNTEKKEVWTYFVNDTFGTPSIVSVTFEGNSVVKVEAKAKTAQ
jgi:outer membrane protein assembly factor BamE (lipoprotein component of BamABCDE complex)